MLAGGVREAGSGVPSGVAEAVSRIYSRQENTRGLEVSGGNLTEKSAEGAGLLLELEDIARERCGTRSGDPNKRQTCI